MSRDPSERVQPAVLSNLSKREKGESGPFMTEFEAIMSGCYDTDLSFPPGRD
jgi:hypothetical protein